MESVKGRGNKNSGKNRNGGAQRSKKGPKALAILGIVAVLALATLMLSFSGASDNDNDGGNETNVGANIGETWDDTPNGLRYTVTGNSPRTASVQQVGAYRSNYTILDTVNIGSTLPDDYTVTSIAASGFQANTSISTITFPSPNTITTIGVQAFYGCTNFYFNGAYSIPSGVTSIGNMAFYGCRFTSVTVPSTVTSMGNSVFQSCTSLTGFTFNTLITTLPNSTFYGCTSLNNVTMPSSITTIGEYAFNGCTALSTITMGSVATIQGYAFSGCTALAGINLSTVTTVNTAAFTGSGLTSISIPSTLTTIQPGAFMTCNSLATITSSNPTYPVVSNVLFSNSGATLHTYPAGLSATSYAIPTTVSSATVTKLENYSFSNAKPATITIPSNITTIGSSVFYFCPNLSTATIPSSVTSSGSDIFVQCSSLTSITVQHTGSQGLSTIPNHLAYSCTNLTSVTLQNGITTISVGAFEGCSKLPTINIPASVIDIKEGAFNLTAGLETITVDPGNANYVTEPSAGGILYNTAKTTIVAYPANFDLGLSTVFTIPNGVTRIAAYAFNSCRLTEVVIPDGVTTIGAFAFGSSSSLLYIYLPSTVTNLEGALFNGVNAIRIFTAPTTMSSATQAYQGQGIAGLQIFYDRDLNISRLVATGSVFFSSSTVSLTTGGTPAFTMSGVYMTVAIPQVVTTFSNITGSGTSYTLTMPVANTAMYRNAIQLSGTYSLTLTTTVVGAPPGGTYQYNMTGGGLNTLLSVPTPGFTAISNSSPQTITVPHGYGLNANGLPVSGYTFSWDLATYVGPTGTKALPATWIASELTPTIAGTFTQQHTVTVSANAGGHFDYKIGAGAVTTLVGTSILVPHNSILEITAVPDSGYTFAWSDPTGVTGNTKSIQITAPTAIGGTFTAGHPITFYQNSHTITSPSPATVPNGSASVAVTFTGPSLAGVTVKMGGTPLPTGAYSLSGSTVTITPSGGVTAALEITAVYSITANGGIALDMSSAEQGSKPTIELIGVSPNFLTVTMGGTTLTEGTDYVYTNLMPNPVTVEIIRSTGVTGNIVITANYNISAFMSAFAVSPTSTTHGSNPLVTLSGVPNTPGSMYIAMGATPLTAGTDYDYTPGTTNSTVQFKIPGGVTAGIVIAANYTITTYMNSHTTSITSVFPGELTTPFNVTLTGGPSAFNVSAQMGATTLPFTYVSESNSINFSGIPGGISDNIVITAHYSVTANGGITVSPTSATHGSNPTITLMGITPDSLTVTMNGSTLLTTEYSFTPGTPNSTVTITRSGGITGPLVVTANYSITTAGNTHTVAPNSVPYRHSAGGPFDVVLSGGPAPTSISSVTMGGVALSASDYSLSGWTVTIDPGTVGVTGSIVITVVSGNTLSLGTSTGTGTIEYYDGSAWVALTSTPVLFAPNTVVDIRATGTGGYLFSYWLSDATPSGNTYETTITMNSNKTVSAMFVPSASSYTITPGTHTNGAISWSIVSPTGPWFELVDPLTVSNGTTVYLAANNDPGYTFSYWTGGIGGNVSPYTYGADVSIMVGAVFYSNTPGSNYTLTPGMISNGSVTWAIGSGVPAAFTSAVTFPVNTVVSLVPAGASGYTFSYWTGDIGGNATPGSVTMDANKTVGAVFYNNTAGNNFTLTPGTISNGSVTWAVGTGVPAAFNSAVTFPATTVVSLVPTAASGYTFSYWTGDIGGNADPGSVTMNANKTVGAVFYNNTAGNNYTLTPGTISNGSVTWAIGTGVPAAFNSAVTFPATTVVSLVPTGAGGFTFSYWTGDIGGNADPGSVTMDANKTVGAVFYNNTAGNNFTLTPGTISNGSVTWAVGTGVPAAFTSAVTFPVSTVVSLVPTGAGGFTFSYWTGDLGGNADPGSVTMDANKTVGAVFYNNTAGNNFTLTPGTISNGSVTWAIGSGVPAAFTSAVTFPDTTVVSLVPTGAGGFAFSYWTGDIGGNADPGSVTMDANKTVGAVFYSTASGDNYTLTPGTISNGSVTWAIGSGVPAAFNSAVTFPATTVVSLVPTGASGYTFSYWTGDLGGNADPGSVTMDANKTVGAVFYNNTAGNNFTLTPGTISNGSVTWAIGSGVPAAFDSAVTFPATTVVSLVPTGASGYTFSYWTGDIGGNADPGSVTMDANKTVGAVFYNNTAGNNYTLTPGTISNGSVTWAIGSGVPAAFNSAVTFPVTTVVSLVPTAAGGYTFSYWTGDLGGNVIPGNVTMDANKTVGAVFVSGATSHTITPDPAMVNGKIQWSYTGLSGSWSDLTSTLTVSNGTTVYLQPVADGGYTFSYWTGDIGGNADPYAYSDNASITVGAVFYSNASGSNYTLTPGTISNGSVTWAIGSGVPAAFTSAVTFPVSTVVSLVPTGAGGFTFSYWTGDLGGNADPGSVTMDANKTVGAVFYSNASGDNYTLTPGTISNGSVTWAIGTGVPAPFISAVTFPATTVVSLVPTAAGGFTFSYWTGDIGGNADPGSVTMDANKTVGAVFYNNTAGNNYTLTPGTISNGSVTWAIGTGVPAAFNSAVTFPATTVVSLVPTGAGGYTFSYWTGDLGGNADPGSVTMDANKTVGAVFYNNTAGNNFTLTPGTISNGSVTWAIGSGVPAAFTSAVTFPDTTVVSLVPTGAGGFTFSYWTGDLGGNADPGSVTMDANKTVGAVFYSTASGDNYTLTPGTISNGSVTWAIGSGVPAAFTSAVTFPATTVVSLVPTGAGGFTFSYWTGDIGGNADPGSVTMDANKTVGAVFYSTASGDNYTLTPGTISNGSVTWAIGSGVPAAFNSAVTFPATTVVSLVPTAAGGYAFSYWTGDLGGNATPGSVTMDANKTVGAVFYSTASGDNYTLTPGTISNGSVTWAIGSGVPAPFTSAVTFPDTTVVSLVPTGASGYTFSYWTGDIGGNADPGSVTMDANKTVGAVFYNNTAGNNYTLTPGTISNGSVTWAIGSGVPAAFNSAVTFPATTVVSLVPTAAGGYIFSYWTGDLSGNVIPGNVTMDANKTVGAVFVSGATSHTITPDPAMVNGKIQWSYTGLSGSWSDLTGTLTVSNGTTVYLQPVADGGYAFSYWTGDIGGNADPYAYSDNASITVGAAFYSTASGDNYTLTPGTISNGSVTWAIGSGVPAAFNSAVTFPVNTVVSLVPTGAGGFTFSYWTGDLGGNADPGSVTMDANKTVGAVFYSTASGDNYTLTPGTISNGSVTWAVGTGVPAAFTSAVTFPATTVVSLVPTGAGGFAFSYWTGDLGGNADPGSVTMDANKTVGAVFYSTASGDNYTLTPGTIANGSVTWAVGTGVPAAFNSAVTFPATTVVSLVPAGAGGYVFSYWTDDLSGNAIPGNVTMDANKTVGAVFVSGATSHTITPDPLMADGKIQWSYTGLSGSWSDLTSTLTVSNGTTVYLQPVADGGYAFSYWTGDIGGNADPYAYSDNASITVGAVFYSTASGDNYTLTPGTIANGSVTWAIGTGTPAPFTSAVTFPVNTVVSLVPTGAGGFTFSYWTGDIGGNADPGSVTMDTNKTVGAVFYSNASGDNYTLTPGTISNGSVTWAVGTGVPAAFTSAVTLPVNTVVSLVPTGAGGFAFSYWTGDIGGNADPGSVTMDANKTVGAVFYSTASGDNYTLTPGTISNGSVTWAIGTGTPAPFTSAVTFPATTVVSLVPTGAGGFTFSYWTGDIGGNADPGSVTMDANKTVGAVFYSTASGDNYTLTPGTISNGSVTWAIGSGVPAPFTSAVTFPATTVVSLVPTGAGGFAFSYWTGDIGGNADPGSVTMDANKTVGAVFYSTASGDNYTLTPGTIANGSVTWAVGTGVPAAFNSAVTFPATTVVSLVPTAAGGYIFSYWTGDLGGNADPGSVTMDANKTVGAVFSNSASTITITLGAHTNGIIEWSLDNSVYNSFPSSGELKVEINTPVWLRATGTSPYEFSSWYGNIDATETNPYAFDGSASIIANALFYDTTGGEGTSYVVIKLGAHDNGTITWSLDDLVYSSFPTSGELKVDINTPVWIQAEGASPYEFSSWYGDILPTYANPYAFNGSASITANALFYDPTGGEGTSYIVITLGAHTNGTITWSLDDITYYAFPTSGELKVEIDTPVWIQAEGVSLYEFSSWYGDIASTETNPYAFDGSESITANALFYDPTGGEGTSYIIIKLGAHDNGIIEWSLDDVKYNAFPASGELKVDINTPVWIQAEGASPYEFSSWYGDILPTYANPYAFNGSVSITANALFYDPTGGEGVSYIVITLGSHTNGVITWSLDDSDYYAFPTSGELKVEIDTPVWIQAEGVSPYEFSSWYGDILPTELNPYAFDGSASITANALFYDQSGGEGTSYIVITLGAHDNGTIEWSLDNAVYSSFPTSGELKVDINTPVWIQAEGASPYEFSSWYGDILPTYANPYAFNGSVSITANALFYDPTGGEGVSYIVITLGAHTNGTITWSLDDGDYYAFPTSGELKVEIDTPVWIKAEGVSPYEFSSWYGNIDATETNPYAFDGSASITANALFYDPSGGEGISYIVVTLGAHTNGIIEWSLDNSVYSSFPASGELKVDINTPVWIQAEGNAPYEFSSWYGDILPTDTNPYAFNGSVSITANALFYDPSGGEGTSYIVITLGAHDNGIITWSLDDLTYYVFPASGELKLEIDTPVWIQAEGAAPYIFSSWYGDIAPTDANPYAFDGSVSITANALFYDPTGGEGTSYIVITLGAHTNGVITWSLDDDTYNAFPTSGELKVEIDTPVWIKAEGNAPYEFSSWYGDILPTYANPYAFNGSVSITANALFYDPSGGEGTSYIIITLGAHDNGIITWSLDDLTYYVFPVSGELKLEIDTPVWIQAEGISPYVFSSWYGDIAPTDANPYAFDGSASITANALFYDPTGGEGTSYIVITLGAHTNGVITWSLDDGTYNAFPASGELKVEIDTPVWIKAEGTAPYVFSSWYGDIDATELNPYAFDGSESITANALFYDPTGGEGTSYIVITLGAHTNGVIEWSLDDVTYNAFPTSGDLKVEINTPVWLFAEGIGAYEFSSWYGDIAATEANPYAFDGSVSITVNALFYDPTGGEGISYIVITLGAHTNGEIMWSLDGDTYNAFPTSGDLKVEINTPVWLFAEGTGAYEFSYWTGGIGAGETNPYLYDGSESIEVGAVFYDAGGTVDVDYYVVTIGNTDHGIVQWSLTGAEWWDFDLSGGVYSKTFPVGTKPIYIMAAADAGYAFSRWSGDISGNGNPYEYADEESITVNAVFLFEYHVTVSYDSAAVVEYTFDDWATVAGVIVFGPEGGHETLTILDGTALGIRVASDHAGYRVEWDDHSFVRSVGEIYTHVVHEDFEVTLYMIKEGEGINVTTVVSLTFILLALLLLIAFLVQRPRIVGLVIQGGTGVKGVRIEYAVKKKGKSASPVKSVTSGNDGRYKIYAPRESEVTIVSVTKEGSDVSGETLATVMIKQKVTEMNIAARAK